MNTQISISTSDRSIRSAFRDQLASKQKNFQQAKIIEELGLTHGSARIDIAVVTNTIHGYEIKSDLDTLFRLPGQMDIFNSVLDRITLVVGKNHLLEAIRIVPEWWGITIAKVKGTNGVVSFCTIRDADENPHKDSFAIASLLWREEALDILEEINEARGLRSKPRKMLYERLAAVMDQEMLRERVRWCLASRIGWRSVTPHKQDDG